MSSQIAEHMTWHTQNQRDDGVLRHPVDGEAWQHFNHIHELFAMEPRNVRLGFLQHLKKKVKNRALVEGSIYEAYIIEEISSFCSLYFELAVQTRLNRVPRNDDGGDVDLLGRLSIFTHPGIFDDIVKGDVVHISEDELEKVRDVRFVKWFKDYESLLDIIKLEYFDMGNKVVLFKCHWFDTEKGIKVDPLHGLVEIKYNSILATNEPFVLVAQAHQVYYRSYPSTKRDQRDWWAVFKTKARSRFHIHSGGDKENEIDFNEEVYQEAVSTSITGTPLEELGDFIVLASGDYEEVNLLITDEEDDMQRDEDEEDDMEGDENEDKDEDEDDDQIEDDDS
ncbi:Uncharacterized protein TCM_018424 [Theobroma cacao]|uniref:DUF4216 domain-containing protein n=1 Tax=Theobroma cacao TaxID=3641 RepID=A0A061EM59_THECC|nr:Uncharacterized protein TCM_018424 [Theobroma cacao]